MLKQVFWIDNSKFVSDVVEATLREENIACFTHNSAEGFEFIVEDLVPEVLVVDTQTIKDDVEGFFSLLNTGINTPKVPVVLVGAEQEIQSIKKNHEDKVKGSISKPLGPMLISQELKKIINFLN